MAQISSNTTVSLDDSDGRSRHARALMRSELVYGEELAIEVVKASKVSEYAGCSLLSIAADIISERFGVKIVVTAGATFDIVSELIS